jgi:hypothetical protein
MGTRGAADSDGALNAGKGGQGKVADPENEVGPRVHRSSPAYPFDHPLLTVNAGNLIR